MNKIKSLLLLTSILILTGCDRTEEIKAQNNHAMHNPQKMGEMPDGRVLYCFEINNPEASHIHFIYYFGARDTNTLSINSTVQSGKTSRNQTIVLENP